MRILLALLILVALAGSAGWLFAARFSHEVESMRQALLAAPLGTPGAPAAPLVAVAPPDGAVAIELTQTGQMRLAPDKPWSDFTATQLAALGKPGFVWDAAIAMAPGVSARVIDSYVDGRGRLSVRLFGFVPMGDSVGPEADRGEVLRYLAELNWMPGVLARNADLMTRAVEGGVEVEGPGGVTVRLAFDAQGRIAEIASQDRKMSTDSGLVAAPWGGRFEDWGPVDGILMPRRGEVWWDLPEGRFVYWRGIITHAHFRDSQGRPVAP